MRVSLQDVEQAIQQFPPEEQRKLLAELPHLLKISATESADLKLVEPSFAFWDNPDDAVYDTL